MKQFTVLMICAIALALLATPVAARIKLASLPDRDQITLRLDNAFFNLIEEERVLTLQEGVNTIDFSWKGVHIDAGSIQIRPVNPKSAVKILNVSYPPGENALVWEVASPTPVVEAFRIAYLLSNIGRSYAYHGIVQQNEKALQLKSRIQLNNQSGEKFTKLAIRRGFGTDFTKDLDNGEAKKMLFFKRQSVPIKKDFVWDSALQPHDPFYQEKTVGIPFYFVFKNDPKHGLGSFPIDAGKMRLFQLDSQGTTAFIGEDNVPLTPINRDVRLYLGDTREIKVSRKQLETRSTNIKKNKDDRIVMIDQEEDYEIKVESFKKEPIELKIVEHFDGEWVFKPKGSIQNKRFDAETLHLFVPLSPGQKTTLKFTIVKRHLFK
ncbi:MAG: hypothetical protein JRJ05_10730 [Deltaproteobacteria bacterium]|nr:hypothetical protein [Deltaproteobacteria bacterium]